jgi:hypothetical protein
MRDNREPKERRDEMAKAAALLPYTITGLFLSPIRLFQPRARRTQIFGRWWCNPPYVQSVGFAWSSESEGRRETKVRGDVA